MDHEDSQRLAPRRTGLGEEDMKDTRNTRYMVLAGTVMIVAAGLLAVPVLHAQAGGPGFHGRGPGGPGHRGGPMGAALRVLRQLDLDESQREQVRAVMEGYQPQLRALTEQLRPAHQALRETVTAEIPDEALIRERSAGVAAVEVELAVLRARIHTDVYQLLTPEQRQRAEELKTRMAERRAERLTRFRERHNPG